MVFLLEMTWGNFSGDFFLKRLLPHHFLEAQLPHSSLPSPSSSPLTLNKSPPPILEGNFSFPSKPHHVCLLRTTPFSVQCSLSL